MNKGESSKGEDNNQENKSHSKRAWTPSILSKATDKKCSQNYKINSLIVPGIIRNM